MSLVAVALNALATCTLIGVDRTKVKRLYGWVWLGALFIALFPLWIELLQNAGGSFSWAAVFRRGDTFVVGFTILLASVGEVALADFPPDAKGVQVACLSFPLLAAVGNVIGYISVGGGNGHDSALLWTAPIVLLLTAVCGVSIARARAGR